MAAKDKSQQANKFHFLEAYTIPRLIKKCPQCGQYTINPSKCPSCGASVVSAHPPRFSIEDRYGKYRRAMKKSLLAEDDVEGDKATS